MINKEEYEGFLPSRYQMFFENGSINPAGDLLHAGIGLPRRHNSWQNTRGFQSFPHYNFVIITSKGRAFYRNEHGFKCELGFGNLILNFPDTKRQYAPILREYWGEFYISASGEIFDTATRHGIISPQQPVWKLHDPPYWLETLKQFARQPVPTLPEERFLRAVQFLGYLLQMLKDGTPEESGQPGLDWFDKACNLLTTDLHHPVDLQKIAEELDMSYHTFRIYFKKRAGVSPLSYRDNRRMEQACEYLLQSPDKDCREIGFIVGYTDLRQFSAQFKKHMGMTPRYYRKKHSKLHHSRG